MIELIIFIVFFVAVLISLELYARKKTCEVGENVSSSVSSVDEECCGQHLVCERETLLQTNAEVEYYDDEELDKLSGMTPDNYSNEQYQAIRDVFDSLQEKDVPGWCRSIQLRNIQLPPDIREEALLIVRERRQNK